MTDRSRKTVGVMGGMGPDATVDFMAKVIAMTESARDQDHVRMLVDQDPGVPDRQVAIREGRDDVSPALARMARGLEAAGADFLVMVCNTAHVFQDAILDSTRIPFVSIIDETVAEIGRVAPDARRVGVMATAGCLATGVYQDAIAASGRKTLVPEGPDLDELMRLIGAIKAGNQGDAVHAGMRDAAAKLVARGAGAIVAGCTEIPLVFTAADCAVPVISSTDVLAARTLELARGDVPLPARN